MWDAGTKTITLRGVRGALEPFPAVTSGIEGWGIIPAWYGDGYAFTAARSGTAPGRLGADIPAVQGSPGALPSALPGAFHIVSLTTPVDVGGGFYEVTLVVSYPARWLGVRNTAPDLFSPIPTEYAVFPGELFDVSLSMADGTYIYLLRGGVSLSPISFSPYRFPPPATNGVVVVLNGARIHAESSITSTYGAIVASGLVVTPTTVTDTFDPERYLYDVEGVGSPPLEVDIFARGSYLLTYWAFDEFGYAYRGNIDHFELSIPYWRANGAVDANGELLTATTDVAPAFQQLPLVLRRFDACRTPAAETQTRDVDGYHYNEPVGLVRDSNAIRTMQLNRYFGGAHGEPAGPYAFSGWQVSASNNGGATWPLELPNALNDISGIRVGSVGHLAPAIGFAMPGNANWVGATSIAWAAGEPWQVLFSVLETSAVQYLDGDDEIGFTGNPISGVVATLPATTYEPQRSFQILSGYKYGSGRLLVTDGLRGLWESNSTGAGWDALPFSPPGASPGMEEGDTPYLLPHFCQIRNNVFGVVQVEKDSYPLRAKFWRSWDTMQSWEGPFDIGTLPAGTTHPAVGVTALSASGSARLCAFNGRDSIWLSDDHGETWTAN